MVPQVLEASTGLAENRQLWNLAEVGTDMTLGVRFVKLPREKWPTAHWAVVGGTPCVVVDYGSVSPPKSYDAARALRHLFEAAVAVVRQHGVRKTLVWAIEDNARLNNSMRPRLRAEAAVCVAASSAASEAKFAAWSEVAAGASADKPKAEYEAAATVCGVSVGAADAYAVLTAIAARSPRPWK
jgi:hypothetical protein